MWSKVYFTDICLFLLFPQTDSAGLCSGAVPHNPNPSSWGWYGGSSPSRTDATTPFCTCLRSQQSICFCPISQDHLELCSPLLMCAIFLPLPSCVSSADLRGACFTPPITPFRPPQVGRVQGFQPSSASMEAADPSPLTAAMRNLSSS